jgi:UDP-N-acetylglucosamine 1-carboxyvinyltransferase
MSKFEITGNVRLNGEIRISGAKNLALKALPAAIIADTISVFDNVPEISDISRMIEILESIGAKVSKSADQITINPSGVNSYKPDEHLIKKLRGSIVIIGPLLAKFGQAVFSEPGGCLIGARPIDDHLDVFRQLGIKISKEGDTYHLVGKPKAGEIILNKMSVTATENAIMASVLSKGTTTIHVAAAEPEIADLAEYLNKMGAKISGAGTHDITIEGVSKLEGSHHKIIPDRLEAGTYLMAAIATNSKILIGPIVSKHMSLVLKKLEMAGAKLEIVKNAGQEYIQTLPRGELKSVDIDTRTYPGFLTDLQSPYAVLMTQAKGESKIFETLFEGRFLYLDEIFQMGAKIEVLSPQMITIKGPVKLKASNIYSRDLRGGASLIIAALIAEGTTTINGLDFIDRGYENIDQKLAGVGAKIRRAEE